MNFHTEADREQGVPENSEPGLARREDGYVAPRLGAQLFRSLRAHPVRKLSCFPPGAVQLRLLEIHLARKIETDNLPRENVRASV